MEAEGGASADVSVVLCENVLTDCLPAPQDTAPGSSIYKVTAVDKDMGSGGSVSYYLQVQHHTFTSPPGGCCGALVYLAAILVPSWFHLDFILVPSWFEHSHPASV